MSRVAPAVLLWAAVVCLPAAGRAQMAAPDSLAPFGWLRDLTGACWRGQAADGEATDTQCYDTQYGHFLRGTIAMVVEAPAKPSASCVATRSGPGTPRAIVSR